LALLPDQLINQWMTSNTNNPAACNCETVASTYGAVINRFPGTGAYLHPPRQQASLRARDLARSRKLVAMWHRYGKVSVFAIMSSTIYLEKLEWISNANQLKFNGRLAQIHLNLIGRAIIAFVCR